MGSLVAFLLLLPSLVFAQSGTAGAPDHHKTRCLGLEYGNYEYENYNWDTIDKSVCTLAGELCLPLGNACTQTSQCCEGSCVLGVCSTVGVTCVADLGEPCAASSECCEGSCVAGFCVVGACTMTLGGTCTSSSDCCEGFCLAGTCTAGCPGDCTLCVPLGDACTASAQCCEGFCFDGSCTTGGLTSTTAASTTTTTTTTTATTTTTIAGVLTPGDVCVTIDATSAGMDNYEFFMADVPFQVTSVACFCDGDCVATIATIELVDRAGNVISPVSPLVCATSGAATYVDTSADSDSNLIAGEGLGITVTNATANEPATEDSVTVCVHVQ